MAIIHRGKNHLKYKRDSLLSVRNRLAEMNIIPLVLIGVSAVALLYLLFNPDIPLNLKYRTPEVWEEWRRKITEYDGPLMILLLPVRLFLGIIMPLLEDVMGSVVRITVYAVPVFTILWQVKNPLMLEFGPSSREEQILNGGIYGEEKALNLMKNLNDDCHVFTNLIIPREEYDEFGEAKTSEADIITVSPSGVTVVEVKYYRGSVHGDSSDHHLIHRKYNRNGTYQDDPFYNPVKQVRTHAQSISDYLKKNGIRANVRKCVFFNHEDFSFMMSDSNGIISRYCPVFLLEDLEDLYDYVDSGKQVLHQDQIDRIVDALEQLR